MWYSFLNTEQEFGNLDFSLISAGSILEVNPKFIKMDQISLFLSLLAYFILPKVVPSVRTNDQRERIVKECTVPIFWPWVH